MKVALIPFQKNLVIRMDNIRFILIVAFAMLVFMLWQAWQLDYGPKPEMAAITDPATAITKEDLPSTGEGVQAQTETVVQNTASAATPSSTIISVKTDVLALEIDTQGGTIRNLDLLNYPVEKENTVVNRLREMVGLPVSEKNLGPVRLFNSEAEKLFVAESGLIADSNSAAAPNHHTVFTAQQNSYQLQAGQDSLTIPLTWTDNNGLVVTKTYTFKPGSYEITMAQKVSNNSGKTWAGRQYSQMLRVPYENKDEKSNSFIRTYTGGVIYTEQNKYQKISYEDMAEENLDVTATGGWSAMIQHYFAAAWIPPVDAENHFYTKELKDYRYVIGSYSAPVTVENNTEQQFVTRLFAGPKIQPMMEKIAKGLELTVDYSWLTFIGKPIYWLLNQIHGFVGNWGFAIMGVTLCIKLLFFKLSQSSFQSMAKMRKIQPRLKELQERFADDRPRFNKEMMDMYKREKVNPLGGCLPILVQIPVFISLYWVLIETVEIRQAPFMLWIQDLSAQDPFYLLPLLYGITMKIQQGLNPAPIDPVQAKVMKMFPIVFTIFFLFFPAGLVLYWIVNNSLSILQQWYITKQIAEAE